MKMKLIVFHLAAAIFWLCGCISAGIDNTAWEGITGSRMRIIVSEFFPYDNNETAERTENQVKEKLNQRATLIIASHISVNLKRDRVTAETDKKLNDLINAAVSKGELVKYGCDENNYCTAHGEYDVAELLKSLDEINSR